MFLDKIDAACKFYFTFTNQLTLKWLALTKCLAFSSDNIIITVDFDFSSAIFPNSTSVNIKVELSQAVNNLTINVSDFASRNTLEKTIIDVKISMFSSE